MCRLRIDASRRRGFSLAETLTATAILGLLAASAAVLASGVESSQQHLVRRSNALAQGRAALARIERTVSQAVGGEAFPACVAFAAVGPDSVSYPDTLVVWRPEGPPANLSAGPLWRELVVYAPDASDPQRLLELRWTGDARAAPPLSDAASWRMQLDALQYSNQVSRVVITDQLRTARTGGGSPQTRAAVRFHVRLHPGDAEWAAFGAGTADWEDLAWPQGLRGPHYGVRTAHCRIDLQVQARADATDAGAEALPFLGSATASFELTP